LTLLSLPKWNRMMTVWPLYAVRLIVALCQKFPTAVPMKAGSPGIPAFADDAVPLYPMSGVRIVQVAPPLVEIFTFPPSYVFSVEYHCQKLSVAYVLLAGTLRGARSSFEFELAE
jgi:hypothetical protein